MRNPTPHPDAPRGCGPPGRHAGSRPRGRALDSARSPRAAGAVGLAALSALTLALGAAACDSGPFILGVEDAPLEWSTTEAQTGPVSWSPLVTSNPGHLEIRGLVYLPMRWRPVVELEASRSELVFRIDSERYGDDRFWIGVETPSWWEYRARLRWLRPGLYQVTVICPEACELGAPEVLFSDTVRVQ